MGNQRARERTQHRPDRHPICSVGKNIAPARSSDRAHDLGTAQRREKLLQKRLGDLLARRDLTGLHRAGSPLSREIQYGSESVVFFGRKRHVFD